MTIEIICSLHLTHFKDQLVEHPTHKLNVSFQNLGWFVFAFVLWGRILVLQNQSFKIYMYILLGAS